MDQLAALVQQGVGDQQVEPTRGIQGQDDCHTDLMSQGFNGPNAAAEEVGEPIEGTVLDPRDHGAGLDGLEDPVLGPLADAHDPAEEDVSVLLTSKVLFFEQDCHTGQD